MLCLESIQENSFRIATMSRPRHYPLKNYIFSNPAYSNLVSTQSSSQKHIYPEETKNSAILIYPWSHTISSLKSPQVPIPSIETDYPMRILITMMAVSSYPSRLTYGHHYRRLLSFPSVPWWIRSHVFSLKSTRQPPPQPCSKQHRTNTDIPFNSSCDHPDCFIQDLIKYYWICYDCRRVNFAQTHLCRAIGVHQLSAMSNSGARDKDGTRKRRLQ